MTQHFESSAWTDFVRGLTEGGVRQEMEEHLASGCRECRATSAMVRKLAAVAAVDAQYNPPAYAVRYAKMLFALQQPESIRILPRIPARLIYDSFRDPLPAGIRSRHRITRHAHYEAGQFSLDFRLEHEHGSPNVTLVGQIVNRKDPAKPPAQLPVFLLAGSHFVATAVTSSLGEFQLEYRPKPGLHLYLPVVTGKLIDVPLNRAQSASRGTMAGSQSRRTGVLKRRPAKPMDGPWNEGER